jgi:mannan endo-1,4-beta-mannosidase
MKFTISAALAVASFVAATPVPDESGLVKRATNAFAVGSKFNIDGSTNYFVGSNSYWISYLNSVADIDQTMAHVAASGLKVLRVWGKQSGRHIKEVILTGSRLQRRSPADLR